MDLCCAVNYQDMYESPTDVVGSYLSVFGKKETHFQGWCFIHQHFEKKTPSDREKKIVGTENPVFDVLLTRLPEIHCFNKFKVNAISTTKTMYKYYPSAFGYNETSR